MDKQIRRSYVFDGFKVDPDHKCLWRGDELIPITPKAFDTLNVLIENRGQVVDKDTLLSRVWENTFVEESTLAQNISTLRKIFASSGSDKQLIETVPRRGYRFVGDVSEVVDEMEVVVFERKTKTEIVTEEGIHETDGGKYLPPKALAGISKQRPFQLLTAFGGIALVAVGIIWYQYFSKPAELAATKFRQTNINRLVSSGNITKVVMSPDGKYVAMLERKDEFQNLFLRQTAGTTSVEIIEPTKDSIVGLSFSPDNEFLYYTTYKRMNPADGIMVGTLYKVPILGGAPEQVVGDIDSPVAISSDGKKAAFIRGNPALRENSLTVLNLESKEEKKLVTRKQEERFSMEGPAWSPDGKAIAVQAYLPSGIGESMELISVNSETGEQKQIIQTPLKWIGQIAWLKDGSGILAAAFTENSPDMTDEIWLVSYPKGEIRQITSGINGAFGISIASDSSSIATVQSKRISSLWVVPSSRIDASTNNQNEKKADSKNEENYIINKDIGGFSAMKAGMSWTQDGKLIYSSAKSGNNDIYVVNGDGTNMRQMTSDPLADMQPVMSPDQKFIAFLSNRTGNVNIWRMNTDGTEQKQLTNFAHATAPSISPDGQWIYFAAYKPDSTAYYLWKIPSSGGEATQLTDAITLMPALSPDGKLIACYQRQKMPDGAYRFPLRMTLVSAEDGSIVRQFEKITFSPNRSPLQWTPDGKAVSYLITQNGASNIWVQPIDGGEPKKYSNWNTDEIFRYAWNADSTKLAFEKGMVINDVLIISDIQK